MIQLIIIKCMNAPMYDNAQLMVVGGQLGDCEIECVLKYFHELAEWHAGEWFTPWDLSRHPFLL